MREDSRDPTLKDTTLFHEYFLSSGEEIRRFSEMSSEIPGFALTEQKQGRRGLISLSNERER